MTIDVLAEFQGLANAEGFDGGVGFVGVDGLLGLLGGLGLLEPIAWVSSEKINCITKTKTMALLNISDLEGDQVR